MPEIRIELKVYHVLWPKKSWSVSTVVFDGFTLLSVFNTSESELIKFTRNSMDVGRLISANWTQPTQHQPTLLREARQQDISPPVYSARGQLNSISEIMKFFSSIFKNKRK